MKNLAILFSIIYCSVFCNTSYSQNISDTVKDVVISIEYDKVYDEFHHVAKIKDFCSNYDNRFQMKDMDLLNTIKRYITMHVKKPQEI